MSKWISVKERLPELGEFSSPCWVIAVIEYTTCNGNVHRDVLPLKYERAVVRGKQVERWWYPWCRIFDREVTHWMPLPEPPESES